MSKRCLGQKRRCDQISTGVCLSENTVGIIESVCKNADKAACWFLTVMKLKQMWHS